MSSQVQNIRSKMVSILREKFAHLNFTFSIGGQISFDVSDDLHNWNIGLIFWSSDRPTWLDLLYIKYILYRFSLKAGIKHTAWDTLMVSMKSTFLVTKLTRLAQKFIVQVLVWCINYEININILLHFLPPCIHM